MNRHPNMPLGASSDPTAPFNSRQQSHCEDGEPEVCTYGLCARYAVGRFAKLRTDRCEKHQEAMERDRND